MKEHEIDQLNQIKRVERTIKPVNSSIERVKFQCNECTYDTFFRKDLRRHSQSVHEGVRYPCDQCNYQSGRTDTLLKHKRTVHNICKVKKSINIEKK